MARSTCWRGWAGSKSRPCAAAVWAPPRPALDVAVDFTDQDLFEVQVYDDDDDTRLTAAIEIVSPGNKDRPSARKAFATKCASYISAGVFVAVIDHRVGLRVARRRFQS